MKIIHANDPGFVEAWARGENGIQSATIFYTNSFREYERLSLGSQIVFDDSFAVVSAQGDVRALVPLYAFKKNDSLEYCYSTLGYLPGPIIAGLPGSKGFDRILKPVVDYIEELSMKKNILGHKVMIDAVELVERRNYSNYFCDFGYKDASTVTTLIQCDLSEEALWGDLRKSYKPLINRAQRDYKTIVVDKDHYDEQLCEEYRKLHALASGRATRAIESFQKMYEMIKIGKAFLVLVQNNLSKTVGSYYFLMHNGYAFYGSAATHPDLGPQAGVGHWGLWKGILSARQLGCKFMDLGQLLSREDITDKERNIDLFKRGFGGRQVSVFRATRRFKT